MIMKDNSPNSPKNKRFFDHLKFLAGLYEIIGERFTAEYQRKQLLKEWIEAFLNEKESLKPVQYQKPIDAPQQKEFKEKVATLLENLNAIVDSFIKKMTEVSAKAIAAAHKTVDTVLASKGIPPLSPTGVAARNMANMAYHTPTMMKLAKEILKPTSATTPAKTHAPFVVGSEEQLLTDKHESLHHPIRTARKDLMDALTEKSSRDDTTANEFFMKFAKLNALMSQGHALHHTCAANPDKDHSVFIEATKSLLSSVEHALFLDEISKATVEEFKKFEAVTADVTHELGDTLSKVGNFFAFFPPAPTHHEPIAEEHIPMQPKKK
jgi:hypothetical protein